jgi:glycosyltransferase involved in cell wall biosynthesis
MTKLISVVIPIYFEELLIESLNERLVNVLNSLIHNYNFEVIYVNDGSTDRSAELLSKICIEDSRFKLIDLSRNFGHQRAITAGIDYSQGDAVIVMDGDLQDPPEFIINLINKWQDGYDVVYAIRLSRMGESYFKKASASLFYKFINFLSNIDIPRNVGDFRLMDKAVVVELCKLRESSRYIRGLVSWVGFKQCGIYYTRDPRYAGETKFSFAKMFKFALDGIFNFSEKPLYIASYVGFGISAVSAVWGLFIAYSYFLGNFVGVLGWSSIMVAILFIGGLQIAFIGLIGQYLGRTYSEVRNRPLYIIKNKINIG